MGILDREPLTYGEAVDLGLYEISDDARASGLPVFDPVSTWIAEYPSEMQEQAAKADRFVRGVTFRFPSSLDPRTPLKVALELLDKELDSVAAHCGGLVVAHEWGLVDVRSQRPSTHAQCHAIPQGYILAARVQSITDTEPLSSATIAQIISGLSDYHAGKKAGDPVLTDLEPRQFAKLRSPGTDPTHGLRLLDIDGRF